MFTFDKNYPTKKKPWWTERFFSTGQIKQLKYKQANKKSSRGALGALLTNVACKLYILAENQNKASSLLVISFTC